jgi:nucleoside-diphosphate-sugar epimerase
VSFESALVTGASGFLGRALTAHLLAGGKRVIVVGRPGPSVLPEAHQALRVASPNGHTIKSCLGAEGVDVVFHCAAYGTVPGQRDMAEMFGANVAAVGAWVETAAIIGARVFVYAGSCSEYGRSLRQTPIKEEDPLAAADLYGASKAAGAQWGGAVAQQLGIGFQWLRLFGAFGPGEASHRLLPYLHAKLSAGQRVDLTPGLQWRDLLYVDDMVHGMIRAAEVAMDGHLGPFNVCSGRAVSVRTFAEIVAETIGGSAIDLLDFGARDYRPDEPMWMVGDPSKFAEAAGFRPTIDVREGIARALHAIRSPASG